MALLDAATVTHRRGEPFGPGFGPLSLCAGSSLLSQAADSSRTVRGQFADKGLLDEALLSGSVLVSTAGTSLMISARFTYDLGEVYL